MARRGAQEAQTGSGPAARVHGRVRPQLLQIATGGWKQALQMSGCPSRARRAMRRIRPQRPHTRWGRSLHEPHSGRRCASRPRTSFTTPQRGQAAACWWSRQRRQRPPAGDRVSGRPVASQLARAGSGSRDPRARSAVINLATEALGDRWSLVVLRDMMFGDRRYFRELLQNSDEGIASNILSQRLKHLEREALLVARPYQRRDGASPPGPRA